MYSHRIRIALAALLLGLLIPASAQAFTLGAADGTADAAPLAQHLGAKTYRLVMDPSQPLDSYAGRIDAYRHLGMRPQIVVGGTGTQVAGKTTRQKWQIVNYAIHALRRWPDAYSVGVVNEPDLSGISACQYARTFRTAYKMLKHEGAKRVLFGEWSPSSPLGWTQAIAERCGGRITTDGFAWHCYDWHPSWVGVDKARAVNKFLRAYRRAVHTRTGAIPGLYCTEYGSGTEGRYMGVDDVTSAKRWGRALAYARKYYKQIVVWGITEAPSGSHWDTSIHRADGSPRPAFGVIARASRV